MNKIIKILRIRDWFEIRLAKETIALQKLYKYSTILYIRYKLESHENIIKKVFPQTYLYDWTSDIGKFQSRLKDIINSEKPDLIIVHQEPNWMVVPTYQLCKQFSIPLIYEVHDMTSFRLPTLELQKQFLKSTLEMQGEKIGFEDCNGIVTVAEEVIEYAKSKYNIKCPYISIPNTFSEDMIVPIKNRLSKLDGINVVYQGGVMGLSKLWGYRYYLDQFKIITSQKIHVHIYTGNCSDLRLLKEYVEESQKNQFLHIYGMINFENLMKEMTKYQWGYSGFSFSNSMPEAIPFLNNTSPNKAWDYLASGIPSIVHNFDNCSRFVNKYNIGFECKNLRNIKQMIEEYNGERNFYNIEMIKHFSMEQQIWKLDRLIRIVLGEI